MASPANPPTIHDVAALSGVSRSTVSRILNNPGTGPATTRAAVESAAKRLGYRPSSAARSLRSGRSDLVAFVVGDLRQPYFSSLARELEHAAEASGRSVMLSDIDRSPDRLRSTLAKLTRLPLDAVVIAVGLDIDTPEIRAELERHRAAGNSVVTTTQHLSYGQFSSVTVAHDEVAFRAVRQLQGRGRTRIALVSGPTEAPHVQKVVRGYLDALPADEREAAMAELIIDGSFQAGSTRSAVTALLRAKRRPDAFLTTTTLSTLGLLSAFEQAGVPEDIDVVCTEHTEVLEFLPRKFSTFGVDYREYASTIMKLVESGPSTPNAIVLQAHPVLMGRD